MPKKKGVEYVQDYFSGDIVTPEKALAIIDKKIANGCSESAFFSLYALGKIAKEHDDTKLGRDVEKRINKIALPYKYAPYREEGAADPVNSKPKETREKKLAGGMHQAFPVIKKGGDPFRMAQISDLYDFLSKSETDGGSLKIKADKRDFINCFTEGNTTSYVWWLSDARELHYIIIEWKRRKYISFNNDSEAWQIASSVFVNGKVSTPEAPMLFDPEDLRKAKNPKNITQDLIDIVEKLNPDNPSPNYQKFVEAEEKRMEYGRQNKEKNAWEKFQDGLDVSDAFE
jgi:hypothetical protein